MGGGEVPFFPECLGIHISPRRHAYAWMGWSKTPIKTSRGGVDQMERRRTGGDMTCPIRRCISSHGGMNMHGLVQDPHTIKRWSGPNGEEERGG